MNSRLAAVLFREFVRSLIREKKERAEAAALHDAIQEGHGDVLAGKTIPLGGDLRSMVAEARRRDEYGWSRSD